MQNKHTSIKLNFIMNVVLNISYIVFPLITFPYISRILLPEGTGKVTFASSVINYFLLFSQLGIQTYGIRECAKLREDREKLSNLVSELLFLNLILTAISYLMLFIMISFIPRFMSDQKLYLIMSVTILLEALGIHYLYKGLEQYSYITFRSIIFKFIAMIAMFLFIHKQSDYVLYGGISVFAASASGLMNFLHSKKFITLRVPHLYKLKRHLRLIGIFFALDCALTLYTNLDVVMLGFLKTDIDVGYYNAAVKIKTLLVSLITSLGAVLLPRISYYKSKNKEAEYKKIIIKAAHFVIVLSVPLMAYFIIFAAPCIYFLSGNDYSSSIMPMQLIMPTLILKGLSNLTGMEILIPWGKEMCVFKSQVWGISADVFLNLILIPKLGVSGAAIATVIAESIVLIVELYYIKKEDKALFKLDINYKILTGVVISIGVSLLFYNKYMKISNYFFILIISAAIFFGIYGGVLLVLKESFCIELIKIIHDKIFEVYHNRRI